MPLTVLDPVPALVVIDLQNGITSRLDPDVLNPVVRNSAALAAAFRDHGLPVVLVTADGTPPGRTEATRNAPARPAPPPGWADPVAALSGHTGDLRIVKRAWGAFSGTSLSAELRARGVTQILLCGVATSIGVESTARSAYDLGLHVALVTDAVADRDSAGHEHSLQHVMPRLGELTDTAAALTALQDLAPVG